MQYGESCSRNIRPVRALGPRRLMRSIAQYLKRVLPQDVDYGREPLFIALTTVGYRAHSTAGSASSPSMNFAFSNRSPAKGPWLSITDRTFQVPRRTRPSKRNDRLI
jgi:hypothetical protein